MTSKTFGEFLAWRRKEKGFTQKELANILYVSESTVAKWEQNRANPDITIVPTLSKILGVSEHELITASIDTEQRENNKRAKKWQHLTLSWNLFFGICYGLALLTCLICNLAISHTLSWFWIVLSSVMLSACFTNLQQFVKKYKLITLSVTPLLCLILLLGVCCAYTGGNWFFVAIVPVIFLFVVVFLPLYIKVYHFPNFVKNCKLILCLLLDFILLIFVLYVIEGFCLANNYIHQKWVTTLALPLCCYCFGISLLIIGVLKQRKLSKSIKTSFVTLIFGVVYIPTQILVETLLFNVLNVQKPSTHLPNFYDWTNPYLNNNIAVIIVASLLVISIIFAVVGIIKRKKN